MKISAISDVHVKSPHDEADRLLCHFLDHPLVQDSDQIFLLGDIFDLMCGPHQDYLKIYAHLFDRMDSLLKQGHKLYFLEGNHDVHLEKLFRKRWLQGELVPCQFPIVQNIEGKTYYFSHGDEHDVDNHTYQQYKRFIHSPPLKIVANHVMPYALLNFLGEKASLFSRRKGSVAFNWEEVREKFRKGVFKTTEGKFDIILGGHSHVQDVFVSEENKFTYVNNGYALKSKTFIYIQNHQVSFESLT